MKDERSKRRAERQAVAAVERVSAEREAPKGCTVPSFSEREEEGMIEVGGGS